MTRPRAKLLIGSAALLGALGYLGFTGVRSGWVYYLDVDTYMTSVEARSSRARLHGVVEDGCDARPAELHARFTLAGAAERLEVEYRGAIPDMFEAGRQVVVEGAMRPDGVFAADVLLTKCGSKYEAETSGGGGT